jgi:predicted nucleic acid-binding protein
VIDSSAWIELFQKSEKSETVRKILKENDCFTNITSLSEISEWSRRNGLDTSSLIDELMRATTILNLDLRTVIIAGRINFYRKKEVKNWGMMDSFVLASSMMHSLKILTKDSHFKDLPNAQII